MLPGPIKVDNDKGSGGVILASELDNRADPEVMAKATNEPDALSEGNSNKEKEVRRSSERSDELGIR